MSGGNAHEGNLGVERTWPSVGEFGVLGQADHVHGPGPTSHVLMVT